jgi:VWFA-related protein
MKTSLCLALLVLLAAPAMPVMAATPATPPSSSTTTASSFGEVVEVNVVNVDVYATDKGGRRVTDLKQGDFELLEDGKPVAITNFTPVRGAGPAAAAAEETRAELAAGSAAGAPAPEGAWNLIVYVDNYNIAPAHRARALRQVRDFLAHGLQPGDRVMVVTSDQGIKVQLPFTSDPAALAAALTATEKVTAHGPGLAVERRQALQAMMTIQENSLMDPEHVPCPLPRTSPPRARGRSCSRSGRSR